MFGLVPVTLILVRVMVQIRYDERLCHNRYAVMDINKRVYRLDTREDEVRDLIPHMGNGRKCGVKVAVFILSTNLKTKTFP